MSNQRRLVKVKLLGELGRKYGRTYSFWAMNCREVLSALTRQIKGLKEYMRQAHLNGVGFKLVTVDPRGLDYEGVFTTCDHLVIAPIVSGAGGNVGNILIGAALVALSFVSFGAGAFAGIGAAGAFGSTALFGIGASLVLTGVAGLLSPTIQTPSTDTQKKESYLFDKAASLTTQGFPVPLLYGRYRIDAALIVSSSITTQQIPV